MKPSHLVEKKKSTEGNQRKKKKIRKKYTQKERPALVKRARGLVRLGET